MNYHTLIVKYSKDEPWVIAFGDYDKEIVKEEKDDSYSDVYKAKIITTKDDQASIASRVDQINADMPRYYDNGNGIIPCE